MSSPVRDACESSWAHVAARNPNSARYKSAAFRSAIARCPASCTRTCWRYVRQDSRRLADTEAGGVQRGSVTVTFSVTFKSCSAQLESAADTGTALYV